MNTIENPLDQLRDIHLPEPISWWPPAPGWWLLALVTLVILGAGLLAARKYLHKNQYRRTALAALQAAYENLHPGDDHRLFLERTAALLRRVAIQAYGRQEVAALTGSRWLGFLDRTGNTDQFSNGPGAVLADGHYKSRVQTDPERLTALLRQWIKEHRQC